ncbi:YifB family Mg chelatase-like AAA ATPase [Pseudohalioglobus lutimaris]|uniref:ATP-dependent protease n=1 Tax=Pseudohalioglobus lutimaris TaxID=1737061 RepID=A0A2N5X1Y0_9GAMM|nr:YifB family Mg chelatase-like AAA ATPase [Pseudohalioglobus lutimaris]PLW68483.1 ATP-dependent protease [Pseudohalioglobus lutimaris]
MELSVIHSRALSGLSAPMVRVEAHLSNGLPAFNIVGLPETAVRESKERVRSALLNSHFEFPDRRITINLAPADLPKVGGRFDLPIALGILIASGQLENRRGEHDEFLGELALDGSLRAVPGVVCAALAASACGNTLFVPTACEHNASQVPDANILAAPDLLTLCAHINGSAALPPSRTAEHRVPASYPDLSDVVGQTSARRALEVAACGAHNLLLSGPPGTGKTLLASRLPGILPPPSKEEALVALALRDFQDAQTTDSALRRPFRSPHHSASAAALIGGGSHPRPGEVSLAHGGVLFLDELPEFNRHCLEALREPLESGQVTLSRARHKLTYPASFQLVAAMNPCPCGYLGDAERACRCTPEQVQRYAGRVSGPLLDRIDMHVPVPRLPAAMLLEKGAGGEPSAAVRSRVIQCRARQLARQQCTNANLHSEPLLDVCQLGEAQRQLLETAAQRLHLSGRALHRTLRVARSIADLDCADVVEENHLSEALAYRPG